MWQNFLAISSALHPPVAFHLKIQVLLYILELLSSVKTKKSLQYMWQTCIHILEQFYNCCKNDLPHFENKTKGT